MIPRSKSDPDTVGGILAYLGAHPGADLRAIAWELLGGRHGTDREVGMIGAALFRLQVEGRTENRGQGFTLRTRPLGPLMRREEPAP